MIPLRQTWPDAFAARYREHGYWRGETFPGFLRERAERFADRVAISDGANTRWTYRDLHERALAAAAGFRALGLSPGDRVIVQLPNIPEFASVVFGLFYAGLVPVYALPAHRLTEIRHFAQRAEASAYVVADRWDGFDYRALARDVIAKAPGLRHVVVVGEAEEFAAFDGFEPDVSFRPAEPSPASVAFLQISGGSSGLSKLIPRTHDDYIYSFRASAEICGLDESDVYMVALPAAHNFPMSSPGFLGALCVGARTVFARSPSPETAFGLIAREKVTMVGLVPPLALMWMQAAARTRHDLSSLKVLQVGGAKFMPESARRVRETLGCSLQQVFGMAEGLVNYTRLDDDDAAVVETQGRPISPHDEVLVVDDAGDPVPDGASGHLLTRGPYTIRGYHNDPDADARAFTPDGFYRTGDIVRRTQAGHLVVQGRAGDHINRAGEKISAEEIEDHLLAHPQVFDVAVVSLPDPYLGERICAFVIPDGEQPSAPALKAFMRERKLADFKVPDQVVFVSEFDKTAVGKISRKDLRAKLRDRFMSQRSSKN